MRREELMRLRNIPLVQAGPENGIAEALDWLTVAIKQWWEKEAERINA